MEPPPSDELATETYHRGRKRDAGLAAAASVAAAVTVACLRYRPQRVSIEGGSMAPSLAPGDWALAVVPRRFARGDVVVVEHPGRPGYEMAKRLTGVPGDAMGDRTLGPDEFWVEGDHEPASTDSRHFGPVHGDALRAKVLLVYGPGDRRRRVR